MEIKVRDRTQMDLKPGQTVHLRVFGGGPFVLIQPADNLLVKSYTPDPEKKRRERSYLMETYIIEDSWIVRNSKGNYLKLPAAALTTKKPITKRDNVFTGMIVASCLALVTAPMWILELSRLF